MSKYDFDLNSCGSELPEIEITTLYGKRLQECRPPDIVPETAIVKIDGTDDKSIYITKDTLNKGIVVIGSSGTGKTNSINFILESVINEIFSQSAKRPSVVLVFDSKGDFHDNFSKKIPAENQLTIYGGYDRYTESLYWNIFGELMDMDEHNQFVYDRFSSDSRALEISKALMENIKSSIQPIFADTAGLIITAVMVYFMRKYTTSSQEMLTTSAWLDFMYNSTVEDLLKILDEEFMRDYRSCKSYICSGSRRMNNQSQGVLTYIDNALRSCFTGKFSGMQDTRKKSFSMRHILNRKTPLVVFFEYNLEFGIQQSPITSLLINLFIKNAIVRRDTRRECYFFCDEFRLLTSVPPLLTTAELFGRSYGYHCCIGLQNVSSVYDMFSNENEAISFLSGLQSVICFSLVDDKSRKYIARRSGENLLAFDYNTRNHTQHLNRSSSTITEFDILNLKFGQAIVHLAGQNPFIFNMPEF